MSDDIFDEAIRNLVAPEHRLAMLDEVIRAIGRSDQAQAAADLQVRVQLLRLVIGDECENFMAGNGPRRAKAGRCIEGGRHALADDGAGQACAPCIIEAIFGGDE